MTNGGGRGCGKQWVLLFSSALHLSLGVSLMSLKTMFHSIDWENKAVLRALVWRSSRFYWTIALNISCPCKKFLVKIKAVKRKWEVPEVQRTYRDFLRLVCCRLLPESQKPPSRIECSNPEEITTGHHPYMLHPMQTSLIDPNSFSGRLSCTVFLDPSDNELRLTYMWKELCLTSPEFCPSSPEFCLSLLFSIPIIVFHEDITNRS